MKASVTIEMALRTDSMRLGSGGDGGGVIPEAAGAEAVEVAVAVAVVLAKSRMISSTPRRSIRDDGVDFITALMASLSLIFFDGW